MVSRITRPLLRLLLILSSPLFVSCHPFFFAGSVSYTYSDNLREAEENTRQGKLDEAIESYRKHILERNETKDRSEWENPYFYNLLISDLYLKKDDPESAVKACDEAREKGVESELLSDRIRLIAAWYQEHGKYKEALDLLTSHHDLDPLLFDAVADRISRKMAEEPDSSLKK